MSETFRIGVSRFASMSSSLEAGGGLDVPNQKNGTAYLNVTFSLHFVEAHCLFGWPGLAPSRVGDVSRIKEILL